jgi:hypothetical protein
MIWDEFAMQGGYGYSNKYIFEAIVRVDGWDDRDNF